MLCGILSFQGDIEEHEEAIASLGLASIKVKSKEALDKVTHLIIPGGESTVIGKFLKKTSLDKEIIRRVNKNTLKVYGTCAGAILLAKKVESKVPINNMGLIDISVSRNAYGSQIDSFEAELGFLPNKKSFTGVFIRAPKILDAEKGVNILCKHQDLTVAARQGNVMVSTFHPEYIRPAFIHEYFLNL